MVLIPAQRPLDGAVGAQPGTCNVCKGVSMIAELSPDKNAMHEVCLSVRVCGCLWSSAACGGLLTSICQASANSWHKAAVQCQKTLLFDQAGSSRKLHGYLAILRSG